MAQMEVWESSPYSHSSEASTNANQSTALLAKREPEYTLNTNVNIISTTMEYVEIHTLFCALKIIEPAAILRRSK
jgi:hypothetical protein